jgi:hypothetical protein
MTRRDAPGTVYLLHFDQPIGNTDSKTGYARHYTGWASDLAARLAEHRARSDVKIMQAVRKAGIGWELARTWPGTRNRERQIKVQGSAARVCPVCKGQKDAERQAAPTSPACRVPAPRQPAEPAPEPAPLWESIISHLEPAEATALLGELADAERAAWEAATPDAGAEYGPRFDVACELSRLRGDEASAAERLAEALAIAQAEGWADLLAPGGRSFDCQAVSRPELPRAQGARVKEDAMDLERDYEEEKYDEAPMHDETKLEDALAQPPHSAYEAEPDGSSQVRTMTDTTRDHNANAGMRGADHPVMVYNRDLSEQPIRWELTDRGGSQATTGQMIEREVGPGYLAAPTADYEAGQ